MADGSDVPAVMPAENLTLKAVWQAKTPRTLTLLYIIDGEPETYPIEQTTLFENDFIVLPDLSAMPHLGFLKLRGSVETGFAQPTPANTMHSVPSRSKCASGLSESRP